MPKTFLICPVRGHDMSETREIVARLEDEGWEVHWPPRNTDQDDDTGLRICQDNRTAIEEADAIHIVWDGKSYGCIFDAGMAWAMHKPLFVIALPEPDQDDGKSFQKMLRAWAELWM